MPYLPVDLDGKRKAEFVDRALGLHRGTTSCGLLDVWEHVWRTKKDTIGDLYLSACFGTDVRIRPALVEAGFIEALPGGEWRIRGAAKWLFGMEGKSRGGHAAKANLVPGAAHLTKKPRKVRSKRTPADEVPKELEAPVVASSAPAEGQPKASPRPPSAPPSALTASSQQPASLLKTTGGFSPVVATQSPDPEYDQLVDDLYGAFREAKGRDPEPSGPDWAALKRIRKRTRAGGAEIVARFRRGLVAQYKGRTDSFVDLERNWDALASEVLQVRPKGAATAADKDQSKTKFTADNQVDFMA